MVPSRLKIRTICISWKAMTLHKTALTRGQPEPGPGEGAHHRAARGLCSSELHSKAPLFHSGWNFSTECLGHTIKCRQIT